MEALVGNWSRPTDLFRLPKGCQAKADRAAGNPRGSSAILNRAEAVRKMSSEMTATAPATITAKGTSLTRIEAVAERKNNRRGQGDRPIGPKAERGRAVSGARDRRFVGRHSGFLRVSRLLSATRGDAPRIRWARIHRFGTVRRIA
jgi:hypothetical protein